jgi:hypothetical protein
MKKYIIQVCLTPESVAGTCADHAMTISAPSLINALRIASAKYPGALSFEAYRAARDFPYLGMFGTELPGQWFDSASMWDVA